MKRAILSALLLTACAAPKPIVTEHVVQMPVMQRCAPPPMPMFEPVPRPTQCKAGMACYTLPDGARLSRDVRALRDWVKVVFDLCVGGK